MTSTSQPPQREPGRAKLAKCPHCSGSVRLPADRLRVGSFRIKCGQCGKSFVLSVDERKQLSVRKSEGDSVSPEIAAALGMSGKPSRPRKPGPTPSASPAKTNESGNAAAVSAQGVETIPSTPA
ncbi:MAG: MJ0042-type zinc finger domain-containing protein, partial [Planctomycetota bacterium]